MKNVREVWDGPQLRAKPGAQIAHATLGISNVCYRILWTVPNAPAGDDAVYIFISRDSCDLVSQGSVQGQ
jgi:hypothetical protein